MKKLLRKTVRKAIRNFKGNPQSLEVLLREKVVPDYGFVYFSKSGSKARKAFYKLNKKTKEK